MRKTLHILLMSVLVLVGCQKAPPAPVQPGNSSQDKPQPVKVSKVTLYAGTRYIDLHSDEPTVINTKTAEVSFYFDGPIDLSSVPRGFDASNYGIPTVSFQLEQGTEVISLPTGLKDAGGNLITGESYPLHWKYFGIVSATLLTHPEIDILNWYANIVEPGEAIRLEFEGQGYKEYIERLFAWYLTDNPEGPIPYNMEWIATNVMHFSLNGPEASWVYISDDEDVSRIHWDLYLAPLQRLIIVDKEGRITRAVDIPLSSIGAVNMTNDYTAVRLVRLGKINKMTHGAHVYQFDPATLKVILENEQAYHWSWPEYYPRADWYHNSVKEVEIRRIGPGSAVGLSFDGYKLAFYREHPSKGFIDVIDLRSSTTMEYELTTHTFEEVMNGWLPHPIIWSADQSRVFYYAHMDGWGINGGKDAGIYSLDLTTGKETLLLAKHRLIDASQYSNHLFAQHENDYYLSNYKGEVTKLNSSQETVEVAKWLDPDRALVNKWLKDYRLDSKTYIYYISENRFEFIAHGAAFDYDQDTGNIYILQRR